MAFGCPHIRLGLGLPLDPAEFQIAVMWWLGMNSSIQSVCPFCPDITLDPLGHHAVIIFAELVKAFLESRVIMMCWSMLGKGQNHKPSMLLLPSHSLLPLCCSLHSRVPKVHSSNDPKCQELGWVCVPLAVKSYGNWGKEAQNTFARLASYPLDLPALP